MIPGFILLYRGMECTTLRDKAGQLEAPSRCYVAITVDDPSSLSGDAQIYNGTNDGLGDIENVVTDYIGMAYDDTPVSTRDPIRDLPAIIYTGPLGTIVQRAAREGDVPRRVRVVRLEHLTIDEQRRVDNAVLEALAKK